MTIFCTILQSNEVYGFVSKDLEEVSSHANTMVKSSSMTIKKTLEVRKRLCDTIRIQESFMVTFH